MQIRRANEKDLSAITDIYNQAIRTKRINDKTHELTVEDRKDWFHEHQDENFGVWVAVDNEKVIGYVSLNRIDPSPYTNSSATISCYLDMNDTGHGLGTKLIKFIIKQAKEHDFKYVLSSAFTINTPSNQMVKKLGFIKYGETPEIEELPGGVTTSISHYALKLK